MAEAHPSLRQCLGRKWRINVFLSGWACLGLSMIPWFLYAYQDKFFFGKYDKASWMGGYLRPLHDHFGLDFLQTMFLALPVTFVVFIFALTIIESMIWRFRMDPGDRAWSSVIWALLSWKSMLSWALPLVLVVIALAALISRDNDADELWEWVLLGAIVVYWAAMPFFVLNAANYGGPESRLIWKPAWPGGQALMISILFVLAFGGVSILLDALKEIGAVSLPLATAIDLISSFVALWAVSYCLFTWLNRSMLSARVRGRVGPFSYRTLAPLFVLSIRSNTLVFLVLLAWVLPPAMLLIFVVPQIEYVLKSQGEKFSPLVMGAIHFSRWISTYWWLIAVVAGPWFTLASQGRLFNLLGLSGSRDSR